jgi:Co/Zn/Cd efflux system component
MTNNKQETGVQWFFDQLVANRIIVIDGSTYWDKVKTKYEILMEQAKEMEKQQKQISYAEGYSEGYKRGLEIIKWNIENQLKKTNENTN